MPSDINLDIDTWTLPSSGILAKFKTNISGLTHQEALQRQKMYGLNIIHKRTATFLSIFIRQLTDNPLILILASATCISYVLGQQVSSYYIFGMILLSVILGVWNEYSAEKTIDYLLKKISPTAVIMRDGEKKEIHAAQLTVGDIIYLSQGSIIPADVRFIKTGDIEVNQSALTGEAETVYKTSSPVITRQPDLNALENIGFMGTTVESGSGKGVVIRIGKDTEYGKIAKSTTFLNPSTEFQKGLAKFGQLIIKVIVVFTIIIFIVNALLGHQVLASLLFALAIAVGLTPELLPILVTVSLSHGARRLSKKHVIAKQLISIENLGNMDILCTDKTGTLTEGKIEVAGFTDRHGQIDSSILMMALLCNSAIVHHKVIGNSIDVALWEHALKNHIVLDGSTIKITEEPFDYNRKAMFTVITQGGETTLIAKGAPDAILAFCGEEKNQEELRTMFTTLWNNGFRAVAIASKHVARKSSYTWKDVENLTFDGYITFLDVPKESVKDAVIKLQSLNVEIKVITGDNEVITQKICSDVGLETGKITVGSEIDTVTDSQLKDIVLKTNVFARVTPQQKLRIIQALQAQGHTVGYLGDGINDIPALHSADVGISVNSAVDVAKNAASIVLLQKSLHVIIDGIIEGRKTFNNTIKYILMGTSSNFGNMFSAAGASFFLPFLPMMPVQILLTNGLYDISQLTIPSDNVDHESLVKPRHWNIDFIKNYMMFFGPVSSIYDFLTFGIMLFIFHAGSILFQTGWFIESLATEILVVFVIRTARTPFYKSRPSVWLMLTCLTIVGVGILLPFTPIGATLGFVAPPPLYFGILILLVTTYLLLIETIKSFFLKKYIL